MMKDSLIVHTVSEDWNNKELTIISEKKIKEDYEGNIFRHRITGEYVYVMSCVMLYWNCATIYFFKGLNHTSEMSKTDFDLCYYKVEKAKYSIKDLETMMFEWEKE